MPKLKESRYEERIPPSTRAWEAKINWQVSRDGRGWSERSVGAAAVEVMQMVQAGCGQLLREAGSPLMQLVMKEEAERLVGPRHQQDEHRQSTGHYYKDLNKIAN